MGASQESNENQESNLKTNVMMKWKASGQGRSNSGVNKEAEIRVRQGRVTKDNAMR